jgi:uncharacterized zinc-type alcohol dehydrogenase-like protein
MQIDTMAAHATGAALKPFTYSSEAPGPNDVVVRVTHCGLCHSDIHMIDDDWQISEYPLVPGHEIVGEVVERGSDVGHLQPGQRVGIGWQRSACLTCDDCLSGNENLCSESQSVIGDGYGGFATHVRVDSRFAFALPDGLEPSTTGPLLCAGITTYSALRYSGLGPGDRVGVIGVGGLGHLAVQFAARMGHPVVVFTTSDDKAELAAELGASEVFVNESPRKVSLSRRLDILLNTAPADLDWEGYMNLLDTDGTLCTVAKPPSPLVLDAMSLMFKRRRVMGSVIGGRAVMNEMLRTAADLGVEPITEHYSLQQVNDAIDAVRDNTVRFRAVLDVAAGS